MIQIIKDSIIIAVLNFRAGKYIINHLESDEDVKLWFSLYAIGECYNIEAGSMMPYDKEISILSKSMSLERKGFQFKTITLKK